VRAFSIKRKKNTEETMIKSLAAGLVLALMALPAHAVGVPESYPPSYKAMLAAAEKEGKVVVYSNTEQFAVNPVLDAFQAAFPNSSSTMSRSNPPSSTTASSARPRPARCRAT
jgi:hypothetical protein